MIEIGVIALIIGSFALAGYIAYLIYNSKCRKSDCCTKDAVMHIERDTEREKSVKQLNLPVSI